MRSLAQAARCENSPVTLITNGRVVSFPEDVPLKAVDVEVAAHVALQLRPGAAVLQALLDAQEAGRTKVAGSGNDEQGVPRTMR